MKQDVVDRYVDDIACTLKVRREELNIVNRNLGTEFFSVLILTFLNRLLLPKGSLPAT